MNRSAIFARPLRGPSMTTTSFIKKFDLVLLTALGSGRAAKEKKELDKNLERGATDAALQILKVRH